MLNFAYILRLALYTPKIQARNTKRQENLIFLMHLVRLKIHCITAALYLGVLIATIRRWIGYPSIVCRVRYKELCPFYPIAACQIWAIIKC
jgi:hypothetical protein